MSGLASDVVKTWDNAEKALGDSTKNALKGTVVAAFDGEMDQVGDIWEKSWDDMVTKVEGLWDKLLTRPLERAMTGLSNMFEELVMKPVSNWFTGLFSGSGDFGIFDVIPAVFGDGWAGGAGGLLKTWAEGNSFADSWLFAGLPGYETVESLTSWASSLFSGEGMAALQSGAASIAGKLGLDSVAAWLSGDTAVEAIYGGYEAAMAAAYEAQYGVAAGGQAASAAGGFSWGAAAGVAAPFAIWEAGALLSGGELPHLTEVPGIIYDGIFGEGHSMTPEEAVVNWEGNLSYMEQMTTQMKELGVSFDELQQGVGMGGFSLFGDSAQHAADALEHLHTVAGYSQEQIDALVESMDPLTQEFVASGQAANELEGEVGGLVQSMNAAMNSYAMSSDAVKGYNQRIADLAERLGLTGQEAKAFRDKIWELAKGFTSGGEEATYFNKALGDFVGNTLGVLTKEAENGKDAIDKLIDSMNRAQGKGEGLKGIGTSTGGGGSGNKSDDDTGEGSSGNKQTTMGVMHGGGYVMGWPKAHSGALISSLAHDEVPLIARRGEYVVRAEAVTPATLPALKALNLGAATQAAAPAVNLHVEIHGNMLGSRDNLEDLARLLEGKLRELDRNRWKA